MADANPSGPGRNPQQNLAADVRNIPASDEVQWEKGVPYRVVTMESGTVRKTQLFPGDVELPKKTAAKAKK